MAAPTFSESIGNTGYIAMSPEATIGTPVIPANFALLDSETMQTVSNFELETPIAGQYMDTFQVLQGLRSHAGDITIIAEPNTAIPIFDMLLARGTVSRSYTFTITSGNATIGATYTNNSVTFTVVATIAAATTLLMTGPGAPAASGTLTKATGTGDATITFSAAVNTVNTWPFTLANPSKSYTIDIPVGSGLVKRFWGCMSEGVAPSWSKNQLMFKSTISALGSFQGRQISVTPTGSGPYTVTLDTTYTPNPTKGLVVGDLIRFYNASNPTVDAAVASIVNATQFTTTTNVTAFASGDFVYLRQQATTYALLAPFLWSNTQFCLAATAAAALIAAQTRFEQGSTFNLAWPFESKDGSPRSGDPDPASLVRLTAQPTVDIKKFFGNPQDIEDFNQLNKNALVIRHYSYSGGNTYELRVTFNHLKTNVPVPNVSSKKVNYSNEKLIPQYDQTDAQGFDVKVIAGLTAIT